MSKKVYLLKNGIEADALRATPYVKENELQHIIEKNPNLLLRESDIKEKNEIFLICPELPLPGTLVETTDLSLDHFMVDKFGVPVLVEVKLMSNPEIRRKVVGQMMEYAARISFYDSTELQEMYSQQNNEEAPTEDAREFWKTVSSNLRAGRLKLVFAADSIPNALKLIIEMLDRTMRDIDVYGVEIKKHSDGRQVFLTTNCVLNTAKTVVSVDDTEGSGRKWTDRDLEERLTANGLKWAFAFFRELREKCNSLKLVGKYGHAETYIPFRWCYKGVLLFSFDVGKSGAMYFNSKGIDILTKHTITRGSLLETLLAIDPGAQYTKQKDSVYLRTLVRYYEDEGKQTRLYDLIERIMNAANESVLSSAD